MRVEWKKYLKKKFKILLSFRYIYLYIEYNTMIMKNQILNNQF